jgi:hypothetical protein
MYESELNGDAKYKLTGYIKSSEQVYLQKKRVANNQR